MIEREFRTSHGELETWAVELGAPSATRHDGAVPQWVEDGFAKFLERKRDPEDHAELRQVLDQLETAIVEIKAQCSEDDLLERIEKDLWF